MYKTAIIGIGRIGFLYDLANQSNVNSHAKAYLLNNNTKLCAVADIENKKIKAFKDTYPNIKAYQSYKLMIQQEKPEIVSVCLPTDKHFECIKYLLTKRCIKAIICEKPFTSSYEEAMKIKEFVEGVNCAIAVNYWTRWSGFYDEIYEIIKQGVIGSLNWANFIYSLGLYNSGCYVIDAIERYIGEIVSVQFILETESVRDSNVISIIHTSNNCYAMIEGNNAKNYLITDYYFYGSEGMLCIKDNGYRLSLYKSLDSKRFGEYKELKKIDEKVIDNNDIPIISLINNIVYHLDKGVPLKCDIDNAIKIHKIIKAILLSKKEFGRIVNIKEIG